MGVVGMVCVWLAVLRVVRLLWHTSLSSSMIAWPIPKHDHLLSVDVVGIGAGKVQHMLKDGEAIQLYQHLHSIEYCWVKNELYLDLWR